MSWSLVKGSTDLPLLGITISDALDHAASRWGSKEALIVVNQDVRRTWSELEERVEALARGLVALGFRPGARVHDQFLQFLVGERSEEETLVFRLRA